ncbi:MAG: hypothetical protein IH598_09775, partial [Bacteroidales bacterium]|nr:hypothetical protein [Bacteroidales bacterium]
MKKVQKPNVYLACNAFWVIVFMLLTFGFQVSRVEAQGVKINNATLKPSGNIKIVVKDGDLINNGIYATASETFTFTGTQAVVVSGTASTTFANLTLNNEAGLTLENDVSISGMLEFLNGKVSTGDHLMTMGPVGTFSNTSSTGYIEGKLAHSFSAPCAKHFPIGKEGAYRPLTLKFSALTGISVVQAEQFETPLTGDLPENTTLMTTGRHWKLTQAGGSGMEYFITLDPTDYSPARPVVMLKQDEGTIGSSDATTPEYTNASPFNTFSEFGLGEVCKNPDDGGNIAGEQYSCNSFDPDEITSTELPSGNTGELDYQWQQSITGSTTGFEIIEGATGASYDPGSIAQTTWFRRLAKVSCKVDWDGYAVSNVVKMTIDVTPPWATAKNNTVELNPYGTYILEATDVLSAWGDSETSVTSIVMNPPSVSCAHLGQTIAVAVTVEDECGNPTTVYSDITVAEGMAIPDPWLNANTHTSAGGTATYSYCDSEGTFRLSATGKSTTTSDVFHFVYQEELCSDQATVIARLAEVENGGWGGVMMRENTTPGAKTILFKTRLYNPNVIIGYRTTTNKSMRNLSQVA